MGTHAVGAPFATAPFCLFDLDPAQRAGEPRAQPGSFD
jgi:hypothetical protein